MSSGSLPPEINVNVTGSSTNITVTALTSESITVQVHETSSITVNTGIENYAVSSAYASVAQLALTSTGTIESASEAGHAVLADLATSASFAITSSFASTYIPPVSVSWASASISSSYADNATSSSYAVTSSYLHGPILQFTGLDGNGDLRTEGEVYYDSTEHTLLFKTDIDTPLQVNEQIVVRVRNVTGATLSKGNAVRFEGATGQRPRGILAIASSADFCNCFVGVVLNDIANNADGFVIVQGVISDVNTSAYSDEDILYVSPSTSGAFTTTAPTPPTKIIRVGMVLHSHNTQGKILVRPANASVPVTALSASYVQASNIDGTVTSASYALTASFATNVPSLEWNNITGTPSGLVSSSVQINTGSFSGSFAGEFAGIGSSITGVVSSSYALSASHAQQADVTDAVAFDNITGKPTLVSASSQVDFSGITGKPTLVSASTQIDFSGISNKPALVSSSAQVNSGSFTGSFTGSATFAVSSSFAQTTLTANNATSASYALTASYVSGAASTWDDISNKPIGLVSSSAQINSGSFTGSFTGSATFAVSSSFAQTAVSSNTSTSASHASAVDFSSVYNKPTLVSSSAQVNSGSFTGSFTGSATSAVSSSFASNALTSNLATTASHANSISSVDFTKITNAPTLISSSAQINTGSFTGSFKGQFDGIGTNITGIVSSSYALSSSHARQADTASSVAFANVTGKPTLVSSSAQVNSGSFTGSFTGSVTNAVTASHADSISSVDWTKVANQPAGLVSSSAQVNSGSFTGSFTGSLLGEASTAISASHAAAVNFTNVYNKPTLVSSSSQINTGSFTGSFIGDGSGITGLISASYALSSSLAQLAKRATTASYADTAGATGGGLTGDGEANFLAMYQSQAVLTTSSIKYESDITQISSSVHVSHSVTGSAFKGDGSQITGVISSSYSVTASYAQNASGGDWDSITGKPTGLVSSSAQVNSGSFTGSFTGSVTHAITASHADSISSLDWSKIANEPVGLVSSSTQINSGSFTGSFTGSSTFAVSSSFAQTALTANSATTATTANAVDFANVTNKPTLFSSSVQVDYGSISNVPSGLVSSSLQISTGSFTGSFTGSATHAVTASHANSISSVDWTKIVNEPVGLVSSSAQVNSGSFTGSFIGSASYANIAGEALAVDYTRVANKPTLVSASSQINTGSFTGSFIGDGSGITGLISASYALSSSFAILARRSVTASYADTAGATGGGLTGDGEIGFYSLYTGASTLTTGSIYQIENAITMSVPVSGANFTASLGFSGDGSGITGVVSSSHALIADSANSVEFTNVANKPSLVSSSLQVNSGSFTGSFTGAFQGIGSGVTGVISSSYAVTASYALNGGSGPTPSIVDSASYGITLEGQSASFYRNATNINAGTLNNARLPSQINVAGYTGSFTGSLTGSATFAVSSSFAQTALSSNTATTASHANSISNVDWTKIVNQPTGLVSSSAQINSGSFTGSFTGSATSAVSSSFASNALTSNLATTASHANSISSVDWTKIANTPSGLVSSSAQVNSGSFTGSFTGSVTFAVSASFAQTALTANSATSADAVAFANITGKPTLVSSSAQVNSGSFTGSFTGSATNAVSSSFATNALTANSATTATSADAVAFANITGKPTLVSSSAQVNSGSFTGSFTGSVTNAVSSSFATNALTANSATVADSANAVAFTNITGKPTLVSASIQIDHDATTNFDAAEHFTQANITTLGTVTVGSVTAILPTGTVSSSAQINTGSFTGSFTGSVTRAVSASYADVAQTLLGSIESASYALTSSYASIAQSVLGSIESASFATTAYTSSYVSGGTWTGGGTFEPPSGSNIDSASYATKATIAPLIVTVNGLYNQYAELPNVPDGEQEWSPSQRVNVNLSGYTHARIGVFVSGAASINSSIALQYSTDQTTWDWLALSGTPSASLTASLGQSLPRINTGSWQDITAGAKSDVYIRWVTVSGSGAATATIGTITMHFK